MRRDIEGLRNSRFDLLVIGGGINGCAIARDAQLRGAKTALIEKDDFASGASGKTTKLIHGGIRYLEQFNFKLVYEALHERATLLKTVPHLVKPFEFLIPVYKDDPRPLLKIKAGIFLYDKLAGKHVICRHRDFGKDDLAVLEPNIAQHNLRGGVAYFDAQVDDVRLCLENAISAYRAGCSVANKLEVVGFVKEKGALCGVYAQDKLSGEKFTIHASVVVNVTGAWSNGLLKIDEPAAPEIVRPTKGIHLVYRRLPHTRAILLSAHKDKRIFFIIPWRDFSLIGTTDTDYSGSCDEVYAAKDEVEYLLKETRRIFPNENIDGGGIITTYAGLRPLVNTQGMPASQVSREHLIRESSSGLISVAGGKYTTYRHLAEQTVDVALSKLKERGFKKCVTGEIGPYEAALAENKTDLAIITRHAVKEEMANTLNDLLVRRLELFMTPSHGLERIEEYAGIMAGLLGWNNARKESEIRIYQDEIRNNAGRSL
ncbi:MAG: glycerol-3-phosphate dehydrogenase/oxidase [Candidatus Omnitrophota bacterium]|nr:glycerol-3-phosphate dehydrogenase/oxidase [Candidatus Omnitrophota bacterium]